MKQERQPFQDITNTVNGYLGGSESELDNNQLPKPKKQFASYLGFTKKEYFADECKLCQLEEKIFKWQDGVFNGYRQYGKPTKLDREAVLDYYRMS